MKSMPDPSQEAEVLPRVPASPTAPLLCEALRCESLADWAFIGEGGDIYLCRFHGGREPVEGWTWIGDGS